MEKTIEQLIKDFSQKNLSLIRDIMEADFIRYEELEFRHGKRGKGRITRKSLKES